MNIMQPYLTLKKAPKILVIQSLPVKYILAFGIGILVGFKALPIGIVSSTYLGIMAICIVSCVQKNIIGFFTFLPYLMYSEIFIRRHASWIPYLSMQYFIIGCFTLLIITGARGKKSHFFGYSILALFTIFEVLNNIYPNKLVNSRAILTHSFALLLPVIWASFTMLAPKHILKLLTHIKIAGVYLTGIIFVAHLTGGIDYGHQSSSEASNGLAPVQLSGYLGLVCVLFFFSIMNPEERKSQMLNFGLLAIVATIMILTFSRGGVYIVGVIVAAYFFYNRSQLGNYLKFLVLIPVGAIIYYSAVESTGGKIVERYELEGSSGRDVLVKIAFVIFSENVIRGVGTGNYNTTIVKEKLYPVESGAHNEFARVAAEHGIIGIFLYWGFFLFLFIDIQKRQKLQKQFGTYFFLLFCLIVVHNGLKISIQPILLMLAVGTTSIYYKKKTVSYVEGFSKEALA